MTMFRAGRARTMVIAGLLALSAAGLSGCDSADPAPADPGPPAVDDAAAVSAPTTTPTSAAVGPGQSDVDGALLSLDDLNLAGYHPFTFPDPDGGVPPRSEDCLARWQRQHKDQRESGTYSNGTSYAVNDNQGPFLIQSASLQPGSGGQDLIAAQRNSYAGPCRTWPNKAGTTTYTAVADTTLGSYGDETYGYKVTANTTNGPTVILVGVMIRKGTLLTTVEYAGSPTISLDRAKAIFASAAKLLPSA